MSYIGIFWGVFWYEFKTFIWKKYSKSKQTKYSGFVKFGVRWAERDKLDEKGNERMVLCIDYLLINSSFLSKIDFNADWNF